MFGGGRGGEGRGGGAASSHLVVHVLPVVEGDQLERIEHRPAEVVEARVAEVRIVADARQTGVVGGTRAASAAKASLGRQPFT